MIVIRLPEEGVMSLEGGFSPAVLDQILRETSEKVCKRIYSAKIYYKDTEGRILFDDVVGRVISGDQKVKVVYVPRQYRRQQVTAEVHYFDVDKRPLLWTRFGLVSNGDILTFTVTRPEDCHYS
jgi:hypothetical protein